MLPYWFTIEHILFLTAELFTLSAELSAAYLRYRWYHCYDDVYWLVSDLYIKFLWLVASGYGIHSQRMLANLPQHCKLRSAVSQSDWHKVGSVDSWSANRWSHNGRSKMHGKTKVNRLSILNIKLFGDQ